MADRWMDERDRDWRDRDWRRSEAYGRGGEPRRYGEQRSWTDAAEDDERYEELRRRRTYDPDDDYGARSSVAGGGAQPYRGQRDYGYARSYRADRDREERRGWRSQEGYGEDFRGPRGGPDDHGYERGYRGGEAGRARWEDRREDAGDFLQRAGERISSWFHGGPPEARREADHYRAIDRGHRGRGPKGYQRTDDRITEDVNDRLTEDPWLDASDIEVAVKEGEVTLSGHVDNREAKHRAERLVEDLSGVRHVQNNLRVDPNAIFTGAGRGYGSSALEAEMRRNELASSPGNRGASGASGRTSTGAAAEPSSGAAAEPKKPS